MDMKISGLLSDLCYLAHAAGNGQTEKGAHGHCPHGLTISYFCSNYQVKKGFIYRHMGVSICREVSVIIHTFDMRRNYNYDR